MGGDVLSGAAHGRLLMMLMLMDTLALLTACALHGGSSAPKYGRELRQTDTHTHTHTQVDCGCDSRKPCMQHVADCEAPDSDCGYF